MIGAKKLRIYRCAGGKKSGKGKGWPKMIDTAPVNVVHALDRGLRERSIRLRRLALRSVQVLKKEPNLPNIIYKVRAAHESRRDKSKRAKRELLDAGVTVYGLLKSESRYLPKILHNEEHIEAVIYGQHNASSAMLIATDERIIYLDKKLMVELFDEVSYEVVSGIQFDIHMFFATVVLHTPVKNYEFKFVNLRCAENFARHIEKHRLEREPKVHDQAVSATPPEIIPTPQDGRELNDMAGYYWLPNDEEERQKLQEAIS